MLVKELILEKTRNVSGGAITGGDIIITGCRRIGSKYSNGLFASIPPLLFSNQVVVERV